MNEIFKLEFVKSFNNGGNEFEKEDDNKNTEMPL